MWLQDISELKKKKNQEFVIIYIRISKKWFNKHYSYVWCANFA